MVILLAVQEGLQRFFAKSMLIQINLQLSTLGRFDAVDSEKSTGFYCAISSLGHRLLGESVN